MPYPFTTQGLKRHLKNHDTVPLKSPCQNICTVVFPRHIEYISKPSGPPPFKCLNIYKYEFGFAEIFVSNFFTEESLTVQNYWQCRTIDTAEPLTLRNHWQCGTIDSAEQLTLQNNWHCGTIDTAEPLTVRNNWHCGKIDSAEPLTLRNNWQCRIIDTAEPLNNAEPLTMRNHWQCETIDNAEQIRTMYTLRNH